MMNITSQINKRIKIQKNMYKNWKWNSKDQDSTQMSFPPSISWLFLHLKQKMNDVYAIYIELLSKNEIREKIKSQPSRGLKVRNGQ
jgi:hypothetical protein